MAPKPFALDQDDDMLDTLTIGRRIRELRLTKGLTLEELATALDRAPSQLSVIENGKRELKLGELQKLARATGGQHRRAAHPGAAVAAGQPRNRPRARAARAALTPRSGSRRCPSASRSATT